MDDNLVDPQTGDRFPVLRGIPRFCSVNNYSESFGYQSNLFDIIQLDVHSGVDHSEQRFYGETGWDLVELRRCTVLEVGSDAGRFSEVFLRTTGGVLHSIDYSSAVEANRRNNAQYGERLQLAQASSTSCPLPTTVSIGCSASVCCSTPPPLKTPSLP